MRKLERTRAEQSFAQILLQTNFACSVHFLGKLANSNWAKSLNEATLTFRSYALHKRPARAAEPNKEILGRSCESLASRRGVDGDQTRVLRTKS